MSRFSQNAYVGYGHVIVRPKSAKPCNPTVARILDIEANYEANNTYKMSGEKKGYVALEFPPVGAQVVRASHVTTNGTPDTPSSESKIQFDRLSISEVIVPHRTQVDPPSVFCGHILKLLVLVGLVVLALLFAQCILYLLYVVFSHCFDANDSNDTRSLHKKISDDFFGAFKSYRRSWR
uniref:SH3 domain-containing protein n=1 Tax=Steinernema glaseri TaxID=37863 RepID=A0A1I7Y9B8_9BILA